MKTTFNVLGVAGSTRRGSYSTQALKIALEHAKKQGAEVRLLEIANMPLYDPNAPASKEVELVAKAVSWADAFIIASPDYHGSMSGALKNFLDHFYEEFAGKIFGFIVASHEKGLTVMDQIRTAVRQCYGWSLPYGVSVNGPQDFTGGELVNARLSKRMQMMARDLVVFCRLLYSRVLSGLGSSVQNTISAH